jgi:hypothetical protein
MQHCAKAILAVLIAATLTQADATGQLPVRETLQYGIEWRLINAGFAKLTLQQNTAPQNQGGTTQLHIESSGLVAKLFKVNDQYRANYEGGFCATDSFLDASEGKRHRETTVKYDRAANKASSVERDFATKTVVKQAEVKISGCVQDILGALYQLRTLRLQPGQSATLKVSDGKKAPEVRVDAQEWEEITTKAGKFKTIRYEAHIFNGVLFERNARAHVWVSEDERRLPVQIKVKMNVAIGAVTMQLEKLERM